MTCVRHGKDFRRRLRDSLSGLLDHCPQVLHLVATIKLDFEGQLARLIHPKVTSAYAI